MRDLLVKAPLLQHFLTDSGFAFGRLVGECGLLISLASTSLCAGRACVEAGGARNVETLVRLNGEISQIGREHQHQLLL